MKTAQQPPLVLNKKLILHFDIDVLKIANLQKDLYVYGLCAEWVWGRLEKSSKQNPDKVTGWKLASNSLSKEQPQPDTITYANYLNEYVKPDEKQREALLLNLSKGPAAKAKSEIEKTIKNITIPKALYDILKESKANSQLERKYAESGKYEILPAFYKMFMNLKKNKREFAIVIENSNPKDNHQQIIDELNLFFSGEHPLYNGKNGTALVKMDGTGKSKNFVFQESHFQSQYLVRQGEEKSQFLASFGGQVYIGEKDPDMLKQTLRSQKKLKICEGAGDIYAYSHSILGEAAFIYCINPSKIHFVDEVDYLTQEIYFSYDVAHSFYNVLGHQIEGVGSFFESVDPFQFCRDVDYFIKKIQKKEQIRAQQIQRIERGQQEPAPEQNLDEVQPDKENVQVQSDSEYLKRTIIPLLDGAFRQVDLFRPQDPISFIALYCLKNKERVE